MFEAMVKKGVTEIIQKVKEASGLDSFTAIFSNVDGYVTIKNVAGEIIYKETLKAHGVEIPNMIMDTLLITKFKEITKVRALKSGKEIMKFDA